MPTIQQLIRKGRKTKRKNRHLRGFEGAPQKRGVVLKIKVIKPKKPNSAYRCVVRVRLSNGMELTAYVPGNGNKFQEHSNVLIQGGRRPDLSGVRHKVIRGVLDDIGETGWKPSQGKDAVQRQQGRSKYGIKKNSGSAPTKIGKGW